jgi:hypothetical protein
MNEQAGLNQEREGMHGISLSPLLLDWGETQLQSQPYHPDPRDGDAMFTENSDINV